MTQLSYPPGISDNESAVSCLCIRVYDRKDATTTSLVKHIFLPMPNEIVSPNTTSWATGGLSILRKAIDEYGNDSLSLDSLGAFYDRAKQNLTKATVGTLMSLGDQASAADAMSYYNKSVSNPYLAALFRGVDFRTFSFSYIFIAFNAEESQTIKEIIKTLRMYSVPPGSAQSGIAQTKLQYPGEVEFEILHNGGTNEYFPKYGRSVITSIDASFSSGQEVAQYEDGAPVTVSLNFTCSEIAIVLRDDIANGY